MRFSRCLKSSAQSLPSPNGAFTATLFPTKLSIRETRSLETTRVVSLPAEFISSNNWFLWSQSSKGILLASKDEIRVYSVDDAQFFGHITNPTSGTTKVVFVTFGSTDDEICIFTEFGLKVSIVDLRTSKSVDINSPKFYTPGTASKGFKYRPHTGNLALLTRHGGKDVISLHAKETYEVTRSWYPDTIDAQGLSWSPDGRWLVIWESSAHGHRAVVYTADGHMFKSWNGPIQSTTDEVDSTLGAGVKLYDWSKDVTTIAISDFSSRVNIVTAPTFTEVVSLIHSASVSPENGLRIWQEQVIPSGESVLERSFLSASQTIFLPTSDSAASTTEPKAGTNMLSFDHSGTLLVTRTESMPTVLWIWDLVSRNLRSVLIFHSSVLKATWHPAINELLLVRCEGDDSRSLVHLWDSSWDSPRIVDFATQMVGGNVIGRTVARWLNVESPTAALHFSDTQDCVLASLADGVADDDDDVALPWTITAKKEYDIYGQREESPLSLVPAPDRFSRVALPEVDDGSTHLSGGTEDIDDTFSFRKFVEPVPVPGKVRSRKT